MCKIFYFPLSIHISVVNHKTLHELSWSSSVPAISNSRSGHPPGPPRFVGPSPSASLLLLSSRHLGLVLRGPAPSLSSRKKKGHYSKGSILVNFKRDLERVI